MSVKETLLERSGSSCELCNSKSDLDVYEVPPVTTSTAEKSILLCGNCQTQINSGSLDNNHWHCLNESMWSEHPAVQVMAWRLLSCLSENGWAQDLVAQLYLEADVLSWAKAGSKDDSSDDDTTPTKDSNGTLLQDGDSVTLIKDLNVKGANFTAKRGTMVKNISLTSNPEHIEGRVNGTVIVLVTAYLKKV